MKLLWQNTTKQPLAMYKRIAKEHLEDVVNHCQIPHTEVAITIVSRRKMQQLNATYRRINEPTDVLTFPGDDTYLGDIIICYDVVVEKAVMLEQTITEYMQFCIVHGLLHAVGYDHQTEAQYQAMMDLQYELIERRTP
jgi:probable rRNA maturation factor